jgi:hypothetical protein
MLSLKTRRKRRKIQLRRKSVVVKNLKHKGLREGCHCIESRDIGAYDTCMNGYKYCYANKKPERAFENYKYHDSDSPLILGHLKDTDIVSQGVAPVKLSRHYRCNYPSTSRHQRCNF